MFVGTDLVHVPGFAEQLRIPGSRFAQRVFTPGELAVAEQKPAGAQWEAHLAGRWAAKEAFVKAWSQSMFGSAPVIAPEALDFREIEVVRDQWGRVQLRLHGEVAARASVMTSCVSISHDGDYATATVIVTGG